MIVADSSVWIEAVRHPASVEGQEVDALLGANQLAVTGVVVAELLQGARGPREFERVRSVLSALPYLDTPFDACARAASMGQSLRRAGITIPLTDRLIAATAIGHGCAVYAVDAHFERIPGLKLHQPRRTP